MSFNAFPLGTENLARLVQDVTLDIPALCRPLKACDLSVCRGTCCHDGVYLTGEEANVIRELVDTDREDLEAVGADIPEKPVVYGKFRDIASGPKTATRPAPMKKWVEDYPEHFEETNCVFLLEDARCSLQVLATESGLDPWYLKPFTCWIHPLSFVTNRYGESVLTLHSPESDPHSFEDYDGFSSKTHCGRCCDSPEGKPAYEVLEAELARLGEIGDRDLLREIRLRLA